MSTTPTLSQLLRLSAAERAELALALWESLSDRERDGCMVLSPEQEAELDRRWAEHVNDPSTAIPWERARAKLLGSE